MLNKLGLNLDSFFFNVRKSFPEEGRLMGGSTSYSAILIKWTNIFLHTSRTSIDIRYCMYMESVKRLFLCSWPTVASALLAIVTLNWLFPLEHKYPSIN